MPRTIKKYANRRLYDTKASQHVTLEGIKKLIVEGEDVEIIDDTSGNDITRNILLQVIADQEQGGRPILSTPMLKHLIRFYGNPMQEFMGQYLEQALEAFMSQQQALEGQFRDAMSQTPFGVMQSMAAKNMEVWTEMQKTFLESLTSGGSKKE